MIESVPKGYSGNSQAPKFTNQLLDLAELACQNELNGIPESPTEDPIMSTAASTAPSKPILAPTGSTHAAPQEYVSIGKGLIIKGEIAATESLFIEGQVEGSISLVGEGSRVTIGKGGVVTANLSAREIVVMGKVRGNIQASERVDIRKDGWLSGDVVTQRITIEDGA